LREGIITDDQVPALFRKLRTDFICGFNANRLRLVPKSADLAKQQEGVILRIFYNENTYLFLYIFTY